MPIDPRRRSRTPAWLVLVVILMLLGGGLAVALALGQEVRIPWFDGPLVLSFGDDQDARSSSRPEGTVAVPMSVRQLPIYKKLTREDLIDPRIGGYRLTYMTPEQVEATGAFTNVGQIIGRVLDHDKAPGYVFTERDFLPEGSRAGLVGGVPPGRRAVRVDAGLIDGLHGLNAGDRLDLLTARTIRFEEGTTPELGGVFGAQAQATQAARALGEQARVTTIVDDAVIVQPVQTRLVPVSNNTLTQGLQTRNKPVQEAVLAVRPEQVAALVSALELQQRMICVARTGQPGGEEEGATPELEPEVPLWGSAGSPTGLRFVETLEGDQLGVTPVPRAGDG